MTRRSLASRIATSFVACLASQFADASPARAQTLQPNLTPIPDGSPPPTLLDLLSSATDTDTPFYTLVTAVNAILADTAVQSAAALNPTLAANCATAAQQLNISPTAGILEPIIIV